MSDKANRTDDGIQEVMDAPKRVFDRIAEGPTKPREIKLTAKEALHLHDAIARKAYALETYRKFEATEREVIGRITERAGFNGDADGWTMEERGDDVLLIEVVDGSG